jgi:hypothetical protein
MQVHAKSAKIGNAKGRKVLTYDEAISAFPYLHCVLCVLPALLCRSGYAKAIAG